LDSDYQPATDLNERGDARIDAKVVAESAFARWKGHLLN